MSVARRVWNAMVGTRYLFDTAPFDLEGGGGLMTNTPGSFGLGAETIPGLFGNALQCGSLTGYLIGPAAATLQGPSAGTPFARYWGGRVLLPAMPDTSTGGTQVLGCWSAAALSQRWRLTIPSSGSAVFQWRRSGATRSVASVAEWSTGDNLQVAWAMDSDGTTTGTTTRFWVSNATTGETIKTTDTAATFYMQDPASEPSMSFGVDQALGVESDVVMDDVAFWNSATDPMDDAAVAWLFNNGSFRQVPTSDPGDGNGGGLRSRDRSRGRA